MKKKHLPENNVCICCGKQATIAIDEPEWPIEYVCNDPECMKYLRDLERDAYSREEVASWYPPKVEEQMAAKPIDHEALFGTPVLHSSKVPCEVTIRFAHGFIIKEDGEAAP